MAGPGPLPRATIVFYALPGFALAMPTIPAYVYLPTLYAGAIGLTATGTLLLAARIVDVVSDPLAGYVSDRFRATWGRRKPWILGGSVLAAAALVRLFDPPADAGGPYLLIWAAVLFVGWTFVAIPYFAWGAELSRDYHERTLLTGGREGAMLLGILAAGAVPVGAAAYGVSERDALTLVSWMAIGLGAPAVALLLWRVPDVPAAAADPQPARPGRALRAMFDNRPFVRLIAAWFVNGLANGFPAVLFPLYLEHGLEASEEQRGILIFTYFLCGVLAIPVWLRLSRRLGKHRAWCVAMALACAAFVWVPWIPAGHIAAFFLVCVVTGMALGADLALPPAMQADVVDLDSLRSGRRRAGMFFALWSMTTKLALACAVGLAFPLVDAAGLDPAGGNPPEVVFVLAVIYALVPVVLKAGAVVLVWHHPITLRRQQIIRRRLETLASRVAAGSRF